MSGPFVSVPLDSVMTVDRNAIDPTDIDPHTPYVGLEDISSDGSVSERATAKSARIRSTKHQFTKDHILFGKLRPYLRKVAAPEFSGVCSTDIIPLLPKASVDKRFLFHWLRTDQIIGLATKASTGANLPRLSPAALLRFEIPLPPIGEQRRIAAVLDKAATLRSQRDKSLELIEELLDSVFLDMFGDPIANPNHWRMSDVNEACELIVDCVNRTAPLSPEPTEYKMIRTSNIKDGRIVLENLRHVTAETFAVWNRRATPQKGDVLVTREAPVGEVGLIRTDHKFFLGQRIMLYRAAAGTSTPEYLAFAFRGADIQRYFKASASGSTVKHLPLPVCRNVPLRLPPYSLQQRFSEIVSRIETMFQNATEAVLQSEHLHSSLQQLAFRGDLDLTEVGLSTREVPSVDPRPMEIRKGHSRSTALFPLPPEPTESVLKMLDAAVEKGEHISWSADYFKHRILGTQRVPFSFYDVMQKAEAVFDETPYNEIRDMILNLLGQDGSSPILTQQFGEGSADEPGRREILFQLA